MFKSLVPLQQGRPGRDRRRPALPPRQDRIARPAASSPRRWWARKQPGNVAYYLATSNKREEIAGYAPVPGHRLDGGRFGIARLLRRAAEQAVPEHARERGDRRQRSSCCSPSSSRARIVRPIQALNGAAHALKAGDYDRANIAGEIQRRGGPARAHVQRDDRRAAPARTRARTAPRRAAGIRKGRRTEWPRLGKLARPGAAGGTIPTGSRRSRASAASSRPGTSTWRSPSASSRASTPSSTCGTSTTSTRSGCRNARYASARPIR